jgi:hypothetical protein
MVPWTSEVTIGMEGSTWMPENTFEDMFMD